MKKTTKNLMVLPYILLIILCYSCNFAGKEYNDTEPNKFIVKEIVERKGLSKMTTYRLLMLDSSGVGEVEFWIIDTNWKYNIGDKLVLQRFY